MKYIQKVKLTDTIDNINLKKVIDETYHKGTNYYEEIEKNQSSREK